jgi:hypothetical protein
MAAVQAPQVTSALPELSYEQVPETDYERESNLNDMMLFVVSLTTSSGLGRSRNTRFIPFRHSRR